MLILAALAGLFELAFVLPSKMLATAQATEQVASTVMPAVQVIATMGVLADTPAPQPTEEVVYRVTIIASKLNIRPCPSIKDSLCDPVGQLSAGDQVDVTLVKDKPDWYLIMSPRWFHDCIWVGCTDHNPDDFSCQSTR